MDSQILPHLKRKDKKYDIHGNHRTDAKYHIHQHPGGCGAMLAIIGGTSLIHAHLPDLTKTVTDTPYGPAEIYLGDIALVLRHQFNRPPHRINFRAMASALALAGVDKVIALGSVGSLKTAHPPGTILLPDDYLSVAPVPSIHNHTQEHVMPEIDAGLRNHLADIIEGARNGGIYAQTAGPRIETRAEIFALAKVADVVGMTVASEAALCNELGIRFAAVCMVDNYAHGVTEDILSYDHILAMARANTNRTETIVESIISSRGDAQ